jgi:rhodanese-related sulfurtransferase
LASAPTRLCRYVFIFNHPQLSKISLPFAHSIPLSQLKSAMKDFSKDVEIVAYCRGPYCFLAKDAVEALKSKGFKAKRLGDSVSEWEIQGLPIEKSA